MDFLRSKLKNRKPKSRFGKAGAILLSSSFVLNLAFFSMSAATAYASSNVPPIVNGWVQVSTPGQLEYIDLNQSSYLNANIELMNNIDLTGYNWSPFGMSTPFSGTFNGQGYQITNVVSNTGGFFGTTIGTIENVGIGATISNGSYSNNGILASVQNGGTIGNSYASGSVSGSVGGNIGGLVGYQNAGSIIKCYSTGSVLSRNGGNDSAGGLVGVSSGSISNSYATGSVSGDSKNGGLVGYLGGGTITNSYVTGLVSGGYNGGLVGYYASGTISSSYFDTTATGTTVGFGSGGSTSGVTGETTANMQRQSTFVGWDFIRTWGISSTRNGGYPYLQFPQNPPTTTDNAPTNWVNKDVTVTLTATDSGSGVVATYYTVDGGAQQTGTNVVVTSEGIHTIAYWSVDAAGNTEKQHNATVKIDKTAPTLAITANSTPLINGTQFDDSQLITLALQATDNLSGIAEQTINVDGKPYVTGTVLDWAGQLGTHAVQIAAKDIAGNVSQSVINVNVKTSISAMERLVERYSASGDLKGSLKKKLLEPLKDAQENVSDGNLEDAIGSLKDFLKNINKLNKESYISDHAKTVLVTDANALIQTWSVNVSDRDHNDKSDESNNKGDNQRNGDNASR